MKLWIDFETRSRVDLKKTGAWRYAEDKSTQVICMAIATDHHSVIWVPSWAGMRRKHDSRVGDLWAHAVIEQATQIVAHNYDFERAIWEHIMYGRYGFPAIPTELWDCTMARAAARCLPRSLEHLALALDVDEQKDAAAGKRLITQLCKPNKKTGRFNEDPEKYARLYEYCLQDNETTKAVDRALPPLSADERETFLLDAEINRRGVGVDRNAVAAIVSILNCEAAKGN